MDLLRAEAEIDRLNRLYARCIDEDRLEEWPSFFLEDGIYGIHPRENLELGLYGHLIYCEGQAMMRDRVRSLRGVNHYNIHYDRHILGGTLVIGEADGIVEARTNYLVVQTDQEGRSMLFSAGEYRDRVVWVDGVPRFKEKVVVPDSFNVVGVLAVPL